MAYRSSDVTRIAQVGGRGFGLVHLDRIDRLVGQGRAELVAVVDPAGPVEGRDVAWYHNLDDLLGDIEVDVVSIATPIGTHMALATRALRAGADVMLEKPPVASIEDFWRLEEVQRETGGAVQIGFQSLGSAGIGRMRELATSLGKLRAVQAWGMWSRDDAYYARARWAGRRVLDGQRVADGVCTNPLAHAFATAFAISGLTSLDTISSITTELYHAHDIEADDTAFVTVRRTHEVPIHAALTLCGPTQAPPTVSVVGERGTVTFSYTVDELTATIDGLRTEETATRTDLLENLLDHRDHGDPLLVPLADTVGFMAVLEATQTAPDPVAIGQDFVEWHGEGPDRYPVIDRIDEWLRDCLGAGVGYEAAGAPWASPEAVAQWRPQP